ncbi:MAG: alkaline phosphatase family protein [Acidobacteriaceae bacterium]
MHSMPQKFLASALMLAVGAAPALAAENQPTTTSTPIKHLVVIFQENVSFDHYFATYPTAANTDGTSFTGAHNTPTVNGLTAGLIAANPNSTKPFRLSSAMNYTCDQDHDYNDEQKAFDQGLMDKFPETVGVGNAGCPDYGHGTGLVMGYYDGNTVTALWNYAQRFAMNDNSFGTTFGPSTPGAINLVSGQTHGVNAGNDVNPGDVIAGSVIGDPDPLYDDCSGSTVIGMSGQNVGDLLNAKGVSWGFFEGGFKPTAVNNNKAVCGATTPNLGGVSQKDYSPHHQPFQYYVSTSNPHHLPPSSVNMIGKQDQANHQYDLTDFWAAVNAGNMPAVSYLKAKRSQDGHAGYSSPLDEQLFLADTINKLEATPEWKTTAVIVAYDDSDGWYDHVMSPILNSSQTAEDFLNAPGQCGNNANNSLGGYQGRCGYGPRLPLLVISPYAKHNFVDHTTTDQSSILRFIEDNWNLGRIGDGSFDSIAGPLDGMFDFQNFGKNGRVFVDPVSGAIVPNFF